MNYEQFLWDFSFAFQIIIAWKIFAHRPIPLWPWKFILRKSGSFTMKLFIESSFHFKFLFFLCDFFFFACEKFILCICFFLFFFLMSIEPVYVHYYLFHYNFDVVTFSDNTIAIFIITQFFKQYQQIKLVKQLRSIAYRRNEFEGVFNTVQRKRTLDKAKCGISAKERNKNYYKQI